MNEPTKLSTADLYKYILYVDSSQDPIISLAKQSGLYALSYVQVINKLNQRPSWLRQAPVIVDTTLRKGYRGESSWSFAKHFVPPVELRQQVNAASRRKQLWEKDAHDAAETKVSSRVSTYYVQN